MATVSKRNKQYDFSKCKQRYIALKILYFGWDLDGLSTQVDNENTVEYHLFQALIKTCLIESRETCKYNRCGRTDKGVSSYGQVVNLMIRSNLTDESDPKNLGLFTPQNYCPLDDIKINKEPLPELNYVDMLNRVLPEEVKVVAWAPVDKEFSSRFNCQSRSYSYMFPKGDLCLESIRQGMSYLIGEHDFRNLCSFDLKNGVTNHTRKILSVRLEPVITLETMNHQSRRLENSYDFYQIIIVGQAFLYHQIRCIMTVLFLIGNRKESPDVIRDLLDISKCSARPNYNRADPLPLSLFDCQYRGENLPLGWIHTESSLNNLIKQIRYMWYKYKTKTLLIERVLMDLDKKQQTDQCGESIGLKSNNIRWKDFGLSCDSMSESKYIPLLGRPRDETLEDKLKAIEAKNQTKTAD